MELKGAVINFLGDSITEGYGASTPEMGYVPALAREFGLKRANNYGIGGTRIARKSVIGPDPVDRDFCMRYVEMDPNADAVVIFGGTNDYGHGDAPLGDPSDKTPATFWGACRYLMENVSVMFVGKPVVIVTPLHRTDENNPLGDGTRTTSTPPLSRYREIILKCAEEFALPVLDLYATSGMQPENPVLRERLMPDGLHPSDEGYAIVAHKIGMFLKNL